MNLRSLPFIVLTAFCFGSSLISSRFGIGQFTPVEFVTLRFAFASCAFALILLFNKSQRWSLSGDMLRHGIVLAIFSTIIPVFSFVGALVYLSSGVTSIINATGPAFTVILAHFFLATESLSWRKVMGVLLSLTGAILLASQGESGLAEVGQANPLGYVLVFIGLVSVSISTIYTRRFTIGIKPLALTSLQLFIATAMVFPTVAIIYGFDLEKINGQGWFALGYGSLVGTVAAFSLFFYTIQRFGATEASLTTYVVPVIATLGGLLLLDEKITGLMVLGMVIILGGIAVINAKTKSQTTPAKA